MDKALCTRPRDLLPKFESAWYAAAYWFHETLAENIDTTAVVKLE